MPRLNMSLVLLVAVLAAPAFTAVQALEPRTLKVVDPEAGQTTIEGLWQPVEWGVNYSNFGNKVTPSVMDYYTSTYMAPPCIRLRAYGPVSVNFRPSQDTCTVRMTALAMDADLKVTKLVDHEFQGGFQPRSLFDIVAGNFALEPTCIFSFDGLMYTASAFFPSITVIAATGCAASNLLDIQDKFESYFQGDPVYRQAYEYAWAPFGPINVRIQPNADAVVNSAFIMPGISCVEADGATPCGTPPLDRPVIAGHPEDNLLNRYSIAADRSEVYAPQITATLGHNEYYFMAPYNKRWKKRNVIFGSSFLFGSFRMRAGQTRGGEDVLLVCNEVASTLGFRATAEDAVPNPSNLDGYSYGDDTMGCQMYKRAGAAPAGKTNFVKNTIEDFGGERQHYTFPDQNGYGHNPGEKRRKRHKRRKRANKAKNPRYKLPSGTA